MKRSCFREVELNRRENLFPRGPQPDKDPTRHNEFLKVVRKQPGHTFSVPLGTDVTYVGIWLIDVPFFCKPSSRLGH